MSARLFPRQGPPGYFGAKPCKGRSARLFPRQGPLYYFRAKPCKGMSARLFSSQALQGNVRHVIFEARSASA
eukprot:13068280-Heterocapsa_arctica.AAC.1